MSESIFKEVTLRRKEILEKVNPKNVELAQSYLKYITKTSHIPNGSCSLKIQQYRQSDNKLIPCSGSG